MKSDVNKYGAVQTRSKLPRILFRWAKKQLRIFPVPGLNTFLTQGFRPYVKSLQLAESPRHANVLLVAFPLTENLTKAAAVTYAQMPRPRILVFVNGQKTTFLPNPNLTIGWDEVNTLPSRLTKFAPINDTIADFSPSFLEKALNDEDENEEDGNSEEEGNGENKHEHKDHQHHEEHGENDETDENSEGGEDNENDNSEDEGHGDEHNHGDGGGMDFMSMVAMTKGQPAGKDGLIMDRNDTYFGPFHSGLPDGLCIKMTLDGDTVISAEMDKDFSGYQNLRNFPENPLQFPVFMAKCFPGESETFRQLAQMALLDSAKKEHVFTPIPVEQERIRNHLLWLTTLMRACGDRGLVHRLVQTLQDDGEKKEPSVEKIEILRKKINKRWYLRTRLQSLVAIPKNLLHHFSGPIAKAAGITTDLRTKNPAYPNFKPVMSEENNAWGHLQVRLNEITKSLDFLKITEPENFESPPTLEPGMFQNNRTGTARLETANGKVELQVEIGEGNVKNIRLKTPSTASAAVLPTLITDIEVADAIASIASLGISPFKIQF